MSVSIAEMERVALGGDSSRFGGGISNVIDLGDFGGGDLGDDLGLSLISNPTKVSSGGGGGGGSVSFSQEPPRTINISNGSQQSQQSQQSMFGERSEPMNIFTQPASNSLGGIDVSPLEPIDNISFNNLDATPIDVTDYGGKPLEVNFVKPQEAPSSMFGGFFGNNQSSTNSGIQLSTSTRDPEQERKDKSDFLNKLQRLDAKGFPVSRKFTMDNGLDEIKAEYYRLVDARQLETSIKFQRQMMIGAITGMEWLNGRFDPFDLKLDGWSESTHENIEDFDEIFEELYDKYKDRGKMSPEMRLIMAVGGSGFMCHVSNTFFRSKMPSMDDVLRKNPELAKQMAAAAAQQAGPGFGNFMGMAMNVQPEQPSGTIPANMGPFVPPPPTGAFFGASAASPLPVQTQSQPPQQPQPLQMPTPRQTARREMAGPSGVDDILKTFEEVRRAEAAERNSMQPAAGFMTQPAVAAVSSGASVVSFDNLSHADSAQTGATGASARRKKRAQPPVGSTLSINV